MSRFLKFAALCFFAALALNLSAIAAPSLISQSAVLIDAKTGQVLYDKAMHEKRHPASITKIATVICGLENASLSDKIVMSYDAVFSVSRDSSHIALDVDEELTVEQASYAALMMSANEACNGIAELAGGDIPTFVEMMNEMARNAGALGTHFANANGLRDPEHYTTAYDMAMICRHAIKNPDFKKIFGTYKYDMAPTNKQPETRHFVNQHSMISIPEFLYDGIVGGKAGWTQDAQYTLVTAAERDGICLIAVVMKSPRNNDKYTDTKALLDYGFENYEKLTLSTADLPRGNGYKLEGGLDILVPKGTSKSDLVITATMENGKDYINVALYDGEEIGRFPCSVTINAAKTVPVQSDSAKSGIHPLAALGIALLSILGLFGLLLLGIIIRKKIYRAIRRRKRRRMHQK
ncbi:MAG: D-alanyl-D-alanine carboxypeptidase [Oscillospiraceae bacterium]|nr:D-alanyl-D-alanine carboxypeptidase [Oscillospiraceae bacterium]